MTRKITCPVCHQPKALRMFPGTGGWFLLCATGCNRASILAALHLVEERTS